MTIQENAMQKLIAAGLFGAGLTPVQTPELVDRYNECLEALGIPPVPLESFDIDGLGWSPQIAEYLKDNFYLNRGVANTMAIILTPDQQNMPAYFPTNSFDRRLLSAFFSNFHVQIADITTTSGLNLDMDSGMTAYENPADLRFVDSVIVHAFADDLLQKAKEQRDLVERYNSSEGAWFDPQLRNQLIESVNRCGDMRYRQVTIGDWRFDDLRCFYTRAFGGVFVLRDLPGGKDILILENNAEAKPKIRGTDVFYITDRALMNRLQEESLIEVDLHWYASNPEILEEKKECLMAELICQNFPDIDYVNLTLPQKKGKLDSLKDKIPKVFYDLERLIRQLARGAVPEFADLSQELRLILLHPNQDLQPAEMEAIGRLIARLQPLSLLCTFTWDKNLFYERYSQWPAAKQNWAIEEIRKHYKPRMHQFSDGCDLGDCLCAKR